MDACEKYIKDNRYNDYLIITPHNWDSQLKKIKLDKI
jgi:hypothetical protein